MKGLIYLWFVTMLERGSHFFMRLGWVVRIGFVLAIIGIAISLTLDAIDPVSRVTEKANKIISQEKETTFRQCIRDDNSSGGIQKCKDAYIQQYR